MDAVQNYATKLKSENNTKALILYAMVIVMFSLYIALPSMIISNNPDQFGVSGAVLCFSLLFMILISLGQTGKNRLMVIMIFVLPIVLSSLCIARFQGEPGLMADQNATNTALYSLSVIMLIFMLMFVFFILKNK